MSVNSKWIQEVQLADRDFIRNTWKCVYIICVIFQSTMCWYMMNCYWLRCSCIYFDKWSSLIPFVYILNISKTNRHTNGLLNSCTCGGYHKISWYFFNYLDKTIRSYYGIKPWQLILYFFLLKYRIICSLSKIKHYIKNVNCISNLQWFPV